MKIVSNTYDSLVELREKIRSNKVLGFDVEATSAHPNPDAVFHHDKVLLVGYGVAFPDGDETYVPMLHEKGENAETEFAREILGLFLNDAEYVVWCHNIKYEIMVKRASGFDPVCKFRCSYLAGWLLNMGLSGGRGLKLKPMVEEYLGHTMTTWEEVASGGLRAHEVPIERMAPYCADDALQCLLLGERMVVDLLEQGLLYVFEELECPYAEVLVHMNEVGAKIDCDFLSGLQVKFEAEEKKIADLFYKMFSIPIGSNKKISIKMYEELKIWPTRGIKVGKSGILSVGEPARVLLRERVAKGTPGYKALELKSRHAKISKLRSTYTHSLVAKAKEFLDGRLRCDFNQAGTGTGRLSSSKPNFQNIPVKGEGVIIREAFIAEEGWILGLADYSGADLVLMAHLSRDERMIDVFKSGRDLHQETADSCGTDRRTGKISNLGLIYEMQEQRLALNLGVSLARGTIVWNNWHAAYPGVHKYHRRMHGFASKHGYVRTITGRRRWIPDINSSNKFKRLLAQRAASNTPAQGSVADVIKIATRNLYREWKERGVIYNYHTGEGKVKIINQVHDEIVCSFKKEFAEEGLRDLVRHMENAVELRAPMRAGPGLGSNWIEAKKDSDVREKAAKKLRMEVG